uniref:ATP-dependent DNA helicase n=1 Tax=Fagus sylvatica TaxID=28930 RepID=A0A2N9FJU1_FAGSY
MKTNEAFEDAREITYADFPTKWVWHNNVKQWQRRKSGNCIGRVYYAHPSSGEKFYLRMLLNIIKGPRNFKEIRTVNNVTYPTYKDACYALGLLDNDNEWHDCMIEASNWASGKQLRQLFVTILMFCKVSDTLNLWESNWKLLTEDILNRQRNVLQFHELILSENQLRNYGLYEIEQILQQYGRSLKDYPQMPQPDLDIIIHNGNRLIQEEMSYNISSLKREHEILFSGLNNEQRPIYNSIMEAVTLERGGMFFVYGHGGTGKTYLYRTILSAIRSEGKIALAVASSGIAALLLPGGRTAHSRFHIPINVNDDSTCDIKQRSQTAELLSKTSIILWDEAPMAHRNCFEALDRSLRDILQLEDPQSVEKPFGGKVVVLGGDFRQILPVVKKGKREDIVYSAISKSYLWNYCHIFKLQTNMRLRQNNMSEMETSSIKDFSEWILKIGDGEFGEEDDDNKITIPNDLIIQSTENPMQDIIDSIYPDLKVKYKDPSYLQDRAILAPTNEVVEELNDYIISSLNEEEHEYLSSDSVCKASSNVADQDVLYPVEFLNTLRFPGLPNHKLTLKVGLPIMLLRNLNQNGGLCNGTRLIITKLATWVIEAEIITGTNIGTRVFIPRITLSPSDSKWPFVLKRRQFPISVCFAMTINKSQGQSLKHVGVYLPKPVFSHGQLDQRQKMTQYALLNQLSSGKDWKVRIRISRMWDAVNSNNNEFISLDMILIDEQNNAIHAVIRKNVAKKFKHLLQEGQLYALSNFQVDTCNATYRPIHAEKKIIFLLTTKIKELEETEISIPSHKFEFVDYDTILQRFNKHVQLSDIIGKVVGIGPIEHPYIKGSNVSMRNINVITTEGNKIRLTLWGSIANQVEDNFCTDNAGPVIIVVTSLIVKAFKGENYLSSTSGTKVYINLDIPETARFMDKQVEDTHSIQEMPRQFKSQRTIEEEMNINRRTITEITNIVGDSDNKEHEELDLPVQIENLIGKTFVFQLELNDFNLLHGWQFFTVKTVFDSILQSDNAFKLDKITECYMSAASNDDLSNLSSEGDDDYAKLQRIDNANDTQLTTTSTITENERNYSLTNAEQKKKKQRIV